MNTIIRPERRRPISSGSLHESLRVGTQPLHGAVEALFSRFDLATRQGYGAFLRAQAAAVVAVEHSLEQADVDALFPDWPERRRGAAVTIDLAAFGATPRPAPCPALRSVEAVLGGLYVLEGSRLGGRLLLRRVAAPGMPVNFLNHGVGHGLWQSFLRILKSFESPGLDVEAMVDSARMVFAVFELAALYEGEQIG